MILVCKNREYMVGQGGELLGNAEEGADSFRSAPSSSARPYRASREELRAAVDYMSSYSLYAAEEELRQGFITVQGGHRIGVAGRTVADRQGVRLMKFISFVNVRVAHQVKGCADGIMGYLYARQPGQPGPHFCNTLIISPPRCGKTTLLRDVIRQVSAGNAFAPGMTVGVVDERSELGACYQGVPVSYTHLDVYKRQGQKGAEPEVFIFNNAQLHLAVPVFQLPDDGPVQVFNGP